MNGYEVKVYFNEVDDCYVAQIVELPGCAVDGETPEEALANLREFQEVWMDGMRLSGHPIPQPRLSDYVSLEGLIGVIDSSKEPRPDRPLTAYGEGLAAKFAKQGLRS